MSDETRILVALGDVSNGRLLCAELRERGYLAGCVDRLAGALLLSDPEQVGHVRAVLADRDVLRERETATLRWFRAVGGGPAVVLLAHAGGAIPPGPWDKVLRRPETVGAVATAVAHLAQTIMPTAADARLGGIEWRFGPPWPVARCRGCGASRHCEQPRNAAERAYVRIAIVRFALQHEHHGEDAPIVERGVATLP